MSASLTPIDHEHTALAVMDYQPGVLQRLDGADALVDRACGAIATARQLSITIAYVHVALSDDERAAVPPTNKMFARLRDIGASVSTGAASSAIDERIAPDNGDIVVRKIRVGAFSTTNLDNQLRERCVDTLFCSPASPRAESFCRPSATPQIATIGCSSSRTCAPFSIPPCTH